jgi:hypothetical protein
VTTADFPAAGAITALINLDGGAVIGDYPAPVRFSARGRRNSAFFASTLSTQIAFDA